MTKKQVGRMIAFALAVCLLLILLCEVFELSDNSYIPSRFKTFYSLEENTLDAVFIGTSGVDRYWVSAKAYEEYGMTVYPLASNGIPAWLYINVIEEVYKTQNPELIILDMRAYGQTPSAKSMESRARNVLDAMDFFSINRVKAAFKTMEVLQEKNDEESGFDLSFLLSFIKYHAKWADEDFSLYDNVCNVECPYMGFFMYKTLSVKTKKNKATVYDNDYYKDMDSFSEDALYELLDYAEEKNINLLFVDTPRMADKDNMGRSNTAYRILEERGFPYINYSQTDETGNFTHIANLDHNHDFYNNNHVNYYGAEKFTATFSSYLNENYDFEDHRSDEAVKVQWDGVYSTIQKKIKKWEDAKK